MGEDIPKDVLYVSLNVPLLKTYVDQATMLVGGSFSDAVTKSKSELSRRQVSADHVTVVYKPSMETVTRLAPLIGHTFDVSLNTIVALKDKSLAALEVDVVGFPDPIPDAHITLFWNDKTRKPVQARNIRSGSLGEFVEHVFCPQVTIPATLQFVTQSRPRGLPGPRGPRS